MSPLVPGTSFAIARLTLLSVSPCFTAPSEKTAKLTTGAPATVTAGTPLACSTVNADDELVEVSLAGMAAAALSAAPIWPLGGGGGGAAPPTDPPSLPPPQPAIATRTRA